MRRLTDPVLVEMPAQQMAVVHTKGDPNQVAQSAIKALYSAVYGLKMGRRKHGGGEDFRVGLLRARWPDLHVVPKSEWTGAWALPIPEDAQSLPTKPGLPPVEIERWEYGLVAQALHLGSYDAEQETIQRLHEFINAQGCEIAGVHEEEYLTRPDAKQPKTIIRYPVRRVG